jgi:hypothetical protein
MDALPAPVEQDLTQALEAQVAKLPSTKRIKKP